jgi:hypothetical protein
MYVSNYYLTFAMYCIDYTCILRKYSYLQIALLYVYGCTVRLSKIPNFIILTKPDLGLICCLESANVV